MDGLIKALSSVKSSLPFSDYHCALQQLQINKPEQWWVWGKRWGGMCKQVGMGGEKFQVWYVTRVSVRMNKCWWEQPCCWDSGSEKWYEAEPEVSELTMLRDTNYVGKWMLRLELPGKGSRERPERGLVYVVKNSFRVTIRMGTILRMGLDGRQWLCGDQQKQQSRSKVEHCWWPLYPTLIQVKKKKERKKNSHQVCKPA